MKSDLEESLVLECLKDDTLYLKETTIEKFPYKLINNGTWNKEIFKEEWFVKYKDFWGLDDKLKEYIKDFDNAPNDKTKLCVFITPYMHYLGDLLGVEEASKRIL